MSEKLIEFIKSSVCVAAAIPVLTRALEQLELKLPLISCSRLSPIHSTFLESIPGILLRANL